MHDQIEIMQLLVNELVHFIYLNITAYILKHG